MISFCRSRLRAEGRKVVLSENETRELHVMSRAVLRKLGGFLDLSGGIIALFDEICRERVEFPAQSMLVQQGGDYSDVWLLDSGWVTRSRHMEDGTRQIVNMAIPGDFIALNALLFASSDFELSAKTDVVAFRFDAGELGRALAVDPRLSAALFWVNAHEESMLAERIVSLGRRSARQRVAHVLCEFVARLEIIGIEDPERVAIPISQTDFSDILGISLVHTNKTLRALERDNVITFRNAVLMVLDRARLEAEAGFEAGYLHFTRRTDRRVGHHAPPLREV